MKEPRKRVKKNRYPINSIRCDGQAQTFIHTCKDTNDESKKIDSNKNKFRALWKEKNTHKLRRRAINMDQKHESGSAAFESLS